jgi:4-hydroxy-tetrahydrodipicolinate reductase
MKKIKVIIYGCGVMGRKMADALLEKKSFELVGALDVDPRLVGWDLGEFLTSKKKLGIIIRDDPKALFSRVKAHAVIHTTSSGLKAVYPQIARCLKAGLNVVSTCEELSFPWKRHPKLSRELDQLAQKCGATVVGTGINPGYLMDTLPLVLTAPCLRVNSVKVTRMMNSARRRLPFQAKVGTGLTVREFRKKIDDKIITGHVGLLESINMIAAGLGWTLDEAVEIPPKPVIAKKPVKTALGVVNPGKVIGLSSLAYAKKGGRKAIVLEFCANAGIRQEYDEVVIEGHPRIHEKILGGVHGDVGTVAVTLNTIPRAVGAPAGLKVMKDLPPAVATL